MRLILAALTPLIAAHVVSCGILYPRASSSRQIVSLDGLWDFSVSDPQSLDRFYSEKWYSKELRAVDGDLEIELMPVPASYNDISTTLKLREYHVGPVWYQRTFYVPKSWREERTWIRFSSVCREAKVWINGELAVTHEIGHLPFQAEISDLIVDGTNLVTVSVDSTLLPNTIPQGSLQNLSSGRTKNSYTFDFFNYGGIDRPVVLYKTPKTYIDDLTITTDLDGSTGIINYEVNVVGSDSAATRINIIDKSGNSVAQNTALKGTIHVENANLWWPYLMDPNPGYLYQFEVKLLTIEGDTLDHYVQPFGIRKLAWDSKSLTINGKPIYFRGFGRHEDADVRGKGLDLAMTLRDYNLIKWLGANSYRTSHYPYAEEILDLADELGIMIIDESPAVNTENFNDALLANHKQSITELINRDKNRPAVVVWSAANEPRTQYAESEDYYRQVIQHLKSLDTTRPVTVVNNQLAPNEYSGQFIDIASANIYHGWYSNTGNLDVAIGQVINDAKAWNDLHNIPVMLTEYGADTEQGLHLIPSSVWSEEYQEDFNAKYWEAFDQMRKEGYFIGEQLWNFADFMTSQRQHRVGGNKKGILTRNRQPKAAAHLTRKRFWALAQELDGVEAPGDLNQYIIA